MSSSDQTGSVGVRLGIPFHRVLAIMAARKGGSIKNLLEEILTGSDEVRAQADAEGIELPTKKEDAAA